MGSAIHLEQADRVEYLEKKRHVSLSGNVRIRLDDNVIHADQVNVDLDAEIITAEGSLLWEGPGLKATGSRMRFNIKSRTGEVEDVTLMAGSWICRGERVEQAREKEIRIEPGILTTCDNSHPHFHIRCRRIRIRLDNDLTARNVTVMVGRTPVFWLPVLATPLKEFRLPFEAQVGRTRQLGMFVRTSPAYEFFPNFPGQAHLDYFSVKGWGYGMTQEVLDKKGERMFRFHGYHIKERVLSYPPAPRNRWELFAEGTRALGPGTRLGINTAYVSDAHFRELYGNRRLPLPTTAGQRHARAVLTQRLPHAHASVMVSRVETQRATIFSVTQTGRFAVSEIRAPQINVSSEPVALRRWLEARVKGHTSRSWVWQNTWWVGEAGISPALEAHSRIPALGRLALAPSLRTVWRDRGDRVPLFDSAGAFSGSFFEDSNHGFTSKARLFSSLQRSLPMDSELSLSHLYVKRLNKIGYDPFGYRGLETDRVSGRLTKRLGGWGEASVSESYDLRNKQDPRLRRWGPVTPRVTLSPGGGFNLSAEAEYDLWWKAWRKASGSLGFKWNDGAGEVLIRPTFIDNRLALPAATRTSREYVVTQDFYYGPTLSHPLSDRRIVYLDGVLGLPLTSRLKLRASGQLDLAPPDDIYLPPAMRGPVERHIRYYTLALTRNLHCWEMTMTFQRFTSGELRFFASMNLLAFPAGKIPLVTL